MLTICAWCNKEISSDAESPEEMISHGICLECQEYFFPPKGPRTFSEFLDLLPAPILVVDDDVRLIAINKKASHLLGKKANKFKGMCLGEAIECPYARLQEGCGKAVHCKSCTVRLTVHDTYTTGQSHYDVPAYQDICFDSEVKNICFLISTEKSGEFVFLKIHEVKDKRCKQEKPRNNFNKRLSPST
jgi:PAS domain-containing protein